MLVLVKTYAAMAGAVASLLISSSSPPPSVDLEAYSGPSLLPGTMKDLTQRSLPHVQRLMDQRLEKCLENEETTFLWENCFYYGIPGMNGQESIANNNNLDSVARMGRSESAAAAAAVSGGTRISRPPTW